MEKEKDLIKELEAAAKGPFYIEKNAFKETYANASNFISIIKGIDPAFFANTPQEVIEKMIEKDSVVSVQVYTKNRGSFLLVHHYEVDGALEAALEELKKW